MSDEPILSGFARLTDGLYLEGLAIDHERDIVWYSDVIGGGIHGVKPDTTRVASFNEGRMWTGGVLVNEGGIILSSGQGGIMWNDPEGGTSGWLVDRIDGQPVNGINEMVPDGQGGLFFGTTDIENVILGQATRPTELYHLTRDQELTRVAGEIGFANGIMFDAVRMRLYCNDTFRGTWAFDVQPDLTLANRLFIVDKEDADGMALDAKGNAWITGFRSGFFARVAPDGDRLADVPTPAGAITQLRFGGADGRDCYFNSVPTDGGDTLKEGGEISARNSILHRARSAVPGHKIEPTRFQIT
jgi:sugar lactone lactonase YvrE